jgi:Ca2+-binding RTX toxin-like protein
MASRPVLAVLLAVFALALPGSAMALPSCAEGPQAVGGVIYGTPCDDTIHAGRGVATVYGEGGDDVIFGGRSNQSLFGGEGNDRLYGGIGDDRLRGGPGDDMLSGGFGADSLDGEAGSDFDRGDATIDRIGDTGPASDTDTLSFATGVTPGFPNAGDMGYEGFPETALGRGVFIELTKKFANDGLAPSGGGVDEPLEAANFESFETIVGTPFDDFIVGGAGDETIYGGGGADVLLGGGGNDHLYGGAEGDYCAGANTTGCEFSGSSHEVSPRDPSLISAGVMAPEESSNPAVYLDGSSDADEVTASFAAGAVTFALGAESKGSFDAKEVVAGGCEPPAAGKVVCPLPATPDAVVLAGLAGDDSLAAPSLPEAASPILLGGEGEDGLTGGPTEDVLVDGAGNDVANAGAGDDAVPNNGGQDRLDAGPGNDLFISNAVCEGDALDGGEGVDNANWANFGSAVTLDLGSGEAGLRGAGDQAECATGTTTALAGLEDIEGSSQGDVLIGDAGANQLLGRPGSDSYFAAAGDDSILANSGDSDTAIDCGEGFDTAQIDTPTAEYSDPTPVDCEAIHERPPNSFRPPDTPPNPEEPTPPEPELRPPPDTTPPRTRLLRRPPSVVFTSSRRRTVVLAFASSEPGSSFLCRLGGRPIRVCRSPRRFTVRPGRHVVRVFAVDAAGNRDASPIVAVFQVKRR